MKKREAIDELGISAWELNDTCKLNNVLKWPCRHLKMKSDIETTLAMPVPDKHSRNPAEKGVRHTIIQKKRRARSNQNSGFVTRKRLCTVEQTNAFLASMDRSPTRRLS